MQSETDDLSILAEERLLRRISPVQIVWSDNQYSYRISSAAFSNSSDGSGMSVSIEKILEQHGLEVRSVLRGYAGFGLVALNAGFIRSHGQAIVRKPVPTDPSHGEVIGEKRRGTKRAFAHHALWVIRPDLDNA